mmetsp:Transcript_12669/g.14549  ORF Transcript_12669/g.14549 Transcript_12669/m.14549 type:complete len:226 (+) Transcript_12669:981-1658(+)
MSRTTASASTESLSKVYSIRLPTHQKVKNHKLLLQNRYEPGPLLRPLKLALMERCLVSSGDVHSSHIEASYTSNRRLLHQCSNFGDIEYESSQGQETAIRKWKRIGRDITALVSHLKRKLHTQTVYWLSGIEDMQSQPLQLLVSEDFLARELQHGRFQNGQDKEPNVQQSEEYPARTGISPTLRTNKVHRQRLYQQLQGHKAPLQMYPNFHLVPYGYRQQIAYHI